MIDFQNNRLVQWLLFEGGAWWATLHNLEVWKQGSKHLGKMSNNILKLINWILQNQVTEKVLEPSN